MLSTERFARAEEYVAWLREAVHESSLPDSLRVRVGGGCLAIAQDHHNAITLLLRLHLFAPAFALVRIALDAYVRGMWLALCATEVQVEAFADGSRPPEFGEMVRHLEATEGFAGGELSSLKLQHWDAMCDYTHTGGLHVQRWNTWDALESNYEAGEVEQVLFFAELIGSLAVIGIAEIGTNEALGRKVLERFRSEWP